MEKIEPICTVSDLKELEVINIYDGKKFGYVFDVEFDLILGKLIAIYVPEKNGFWQIFKKNKKSKIRIPFHDIDRIGNDTILVRYKELL